MASLFQVGRLTHGQAVGGMTTNWDLLVRVAWPGCLLVFAERGFSGLRAKEREREREREREKERERDKVTDLKKR